ncbi:MAG: hypothetical protein ABIA59_04200 [Candidatus Latescibacterota bacterium]
MASRHTCRVPGLLLGLAATLVLIVPFQAQADSNEGGLTGFIEAYRVITGDDGTEQLLPAEKARPRDIIEYKLMYENTSSTSLQNITITDPIPSGTSYIAETAHLPQDGLIQFSIDQGKSYQAWPVKVLVVTEDGEEVLRNAAVEEVTHIRWTLEEDIDPDGGVVVSYRACVK